MRAPRRRRGAARRLTRAPPDESAQTAPRSEPVRTAAVSSYCHQQGVVTLTCGTWGNVVRFLPPLAISDGLLDEALDVVADAFAATA